jgi:hypothetical protein
VKSKLLYTNGERIAELFWVTHTGTDVYCGMPKSDRKMSYHASGKLHIKNDGDEQSANWVAPLNEIKRLFNLTTIGFQNSRTWDDRAYRSIEYSNKKLDNTIFIDSRSIPDKEHVSIMVGLMEPNNYSVLNGITRKLENVKQVNLATHEEPWLCSIIIWPLVFPENA